VALAAAQACHQVAGVDARLKWPNDLVVGDAKLAGVLAEAEFDTRSVRSVVVGIGINVAWPGPPGVGGTCLDDLRESGAAVDRAQLLEAVLAALGVRRPLLDDPAGRHRLATEFRECCATVGVEVRVELPGTEIVGVASGIDDAGHLIVDTAHGTRVVAAGDVVHLRPR
jgi:BirA family biotin operon repressor/biotin-[acetyl-CoA-carboxylase] ligase